MVIETHKIALALPAHSAKGSPGHFAMGGAVTPLQCTHSYCILSQSQHCLVTASWSIKMTIKIVLPLNKNISHCPKLQGKSNPPHPPQKKKSQGISDGYSDRDAFPCDTTLRAQTPHSTDFITLHIIRQAVRRGCASVTTTSQFWLHLPLHGSSSPVQAANVVFHLPAAWRCKPYPAGRMLPWHLAVFQTGIAWGFTTILPFYTVSGGGGCRIAMHGRKLFTTFFVISESNVGEFKRWFRCKLTRWRSRERKVKTGHSI